MDHPIVITFKKNETEIILHPTQRDCLPVFGSVIEDRPGLKVVPAGAIIRGIFSVLRQVFGRGGRVAEWTRGWACKWEVIEPESGLIMGEFESHGQAVEFEIDYLRGDHA